MQNDIQTPITESLIREVLTSYDRYRGKYKLNTLLMMTPDDIIKQIAEDLKKEHAKDKR